MWWYDGGGSPLMVSFMVVFWVLLLGVLYVAVRNLPARREPDGSRTPARRLLDERLARGEIDEEEYVRRRDLLDDRR
jgi:putative membrane protein